MRGAHLEAVRRAVRSNLGADREASCEHLEAPGRACAQILKQPAPISEQPAPISKQTPVFIPVKPGRYQAAALRPLRVGVGPRPFQGLPGGLASRPVRSVTWGRGPVVLAGVAAVCNRYCFGESQGGVVTPGRLGLKSWSSGGPTASSWGLFKGPGGSAEGTSSSGSFLRVL